MKLPQKDPEELKVVPFDFSSELSSTETIASVTVAINVVGGTDPAPGNVLDGAAVIDNPSKQVWQRVKAGVDQCDYELRCVATGNSGLKHLIVGTLPVRIEH